MLYIIGLGLNKKGITMEALEAIKKCKRVYLENYTVDFPYTENELKEIIDKKIIPADREFVESLEIIDEAKKLNVALLVYGAPLTATTHISLIQEAKECRVKCKLIYSASILDAVAETGLQIYKFGKITSIPNFEADSYLETVKENTSIKAHSLLLIDIGLESNKVLDKLQKDADKHKIKLKKLLLCSCLGTKKKKIYYNTLENLKEKDIRKPYCIVIPGKLHFIEKEILEKFFT